MSSASRNPAPLKIVGYITDSFGAITTFSFFVSVNFPVGTIDSIISNGLVSLGLISSLGDLNSAAQLVGGLAQILLLSDSVVFIFI